MSVRSELAVALVGALPPTWRMIDTGENIEPPPATIPAVLQLMRTDVAPGLTQALRAHEYTLQLMEPHLTGVSGEDALDENLDTVLDALETLPAVEFLRAERGTWPRDVYPSYAIALRVQANKKETT